MTFCTFSLTFAVEALIEYEKFNDTNDNDNTWVDLGTCNQGVKIQYTLYPGYNYELDILIWPNAGKIWCGNVFGWVRTWQFLNKHWIAFTIRHKVPVKVEEFLDHQIFVIPGGITAFGTNAKNDRNFVIRMPALKFRELLYFARVEETQADIVKSIVDLVWLNLSNFIPPSYLDGPFDTPEPVTDCRHQDGIISYLKDKVLFSNLEINKINNRVTETDASYLKEKGKKAGVETENTVYKLKLAGDAIIAGSGRINRFQELGQCSSSQGRILAILSSSNLPTPDDLPVVVININKLKRIPVEEFNKAGLSQIYTRWKIGTKEYNSQVKPLHTEISMSDYHVIPIQGSLVREIPNVFIDNFFEIQLRGVRDATKIVNHPKLFNNDCSCKFISTTNDVKEADVLIACSRIDTQQLFNHPNKMISGEFPFVASQASYFNLKYYCTNHVNSAKMSEKHEKHLSPYIVLKTNMVVHLSIGFLGCEIHLTRALFSRLHCFCVKGNTAYKILNKIEQINEKALLLPNNECILTGFSIDTGDSLIIFVEGEKNKSIIKVWEITESFDNDIKAVFSSSETYLEQVFPETWAPETPFQYLIMRIPLSILLACPPLYVTPALPLPAKTAMLKISHILMGKTYKTPSRKDMPTLAELRSFKLELCLPLRLHPTRDIAFNSYQYAKKISTFYALQGQRHKGREHRGNLPRLELMAPLVPFKR